LTGKKRILFIEDEEFLLEQLQIALSEYDIVPASSAQKGLELIQKMDFDGVLLDIMMAPSDDMDPEMVGYGRATGVEICRRIRNEHPDLPIVILSVVRDTKILNRIKEAGANEIINKPVSPSKIKEILGRVLDSHLSNK
jgi:CheY-like chemotaxis protein